MSERTRGRRAVEPLERRTLMSVVPYVYQKIGTNQNSGYALGTPLAVDAAGNVYGFNVGVYEVARGTGTVEPRAFVSQVGGLNPGRPAVDARGDLFGVAVLQNTTNFAASLGNPEVVFEVKAGSSAVTYPFGVPSDVSPTGAVIPNATGKLGGPFGDLVVDAAGDLFGTSGYGGGTAASSALYEVRAGTTKPVVRATFGSINISTGIYTIPESANPSDIAVDRGGDVFGHSSLHGGSFWEVAHGSHVARTILTDAAAGITGAGGPLATDKAGDLYGVATLAADGTAAVVEIARGTHRLAVLARSASAGLDPYLAVDPAGDVFGSTPTGGTAADGSVFEVPHGTRKLATLYSSPTPGGVTGLTRDAAGNLYATDGTVVFELSPGKADPGQAIAVTTAVSAVTAPAVAVPGDTATATVTVTNAGPTRQTGTLALSLALSSSSATPTLANAVAVTATTGTTPTVDLAPGGSATLPVSFTIPETAAAGGFALLVTAAVKAGFTGTVSRQPAASPNAVAVSLEFGTVGTRTAVPLTVTDASGEATTYTLSGPGTGRLSSLSPGVYSADVTGTTAASALTVSSPAADAAVGQLQVEDPIGSIEAGGVIPAGVTAESDVSSVTVGGLSDFAGLAVDGTAPVTLSLGTAIDASVSSTAPITSLTVATWTNPGETRQLGGGTENYPGDGGITAPSIGTFDDAGDFAGYVAVKTIGTFAVGGNLAGDVLAGADLGDDGVGNSDGTVHGVDTFGVGTIGTLRVGGSVLPRTIVAAGLTVADDTFPPTAANAALLAGGKIGSVTVGGSMGTGAVVVAAALPATATVGGMAVATADAPGFALPAPAVSS